MFIVWLYMPFLQAEQSTHKSKLTEQRNLRIRLCLPGQISVKAVKMISDSHHPWIDYHASPSSMLHILDFIFKIVLWHVKLCYNLDFACQIFFILVTQ